MKRTLTIPEQHQLKIARSTLRLSDVGARIIGGMTKDEAREIIRRLTGNTRADKVDGAIKAYFQSKDAFDREEAWSAWGKALDEKE